jgi:hypothetical protein
VRSIRRFAGDRSGAWSPRLRSACPSRSALLRGKGTGLARLERNCICRAAIGRCGRRAGLAQERRNRALRCALGDDEFTSVSISMETCALSWISIDGCGSRTMCRSGGNHLPDAGASRAQFLLLRIPTRPGVWCCNGFCSDDRTSGVPTWTPAGLKRGAAVGEECLASPTWLATEVILRELHK